MRGGVASALAINGVTRRRAIGSDAPIGVITTASFALGLALLALFGHRGQSFDAALFGSILGVSRQDVIGVAGVSVLAGALVLLRYRELLFTTFDPEVAEGLWGPHARIDALLMLVLAGSILATMQVLGVTLIAVPGDRTAACAPSGRLAPSLQPGARLTGRQRGTLGRAIGKD